MPNKTNRDHYAAQLGKPSERVSLQFEDHQFRVGGGEPPNREWKRALLKIKKLILEELSKTQKVEESLALEQYAKLSLPFADFYLPKELVELLRRKTLLTKEFQKAFTAIRPQDSYQPTCICFGRVPGDENPILDWRKISQPFPQQYAFFLLEDVLKVVVSDEPSLPVTKMWVGLQARGRENNHPSINWRKEISAWNFCTHSKISSVSTEDANRGPNWMLLEKSVCLAGTDTIILRKMKALGRMHDMYNFNMDCFWAVWGGKRVLFEWVGDTHIYGLRGADLPRTGLECG